MIIAMIYKKINIILSNRKIKNNLARWIENKVPRTIEEIVRNNKLPIVVEKISKPGSREHYFGIGFKGIILDNDNIIYIWDIKSKKVSMLLDTKSWRVLK